MADKEESMQCRKLSLHLETGFAIAVVNLILAGSLWASQEQTLYSFGTAPDGNYPASSLVFDLSGNLYGTTLQGGKLGAGMVFKLTPGNGQWTERVLYNFCQQNGCTDGSTPYGQLAFDSKGNLYGTTYQGGAYGQGVAFQLTGHPDGTWTETVLHNFGNGTDGAGPLAGMIFDTVGNLYGTTSTGGTSGSNCFAGCGTIFELTSGINGQWTETVLYNFCSQANCADGNSLTAGLILDTSGNLYGTTAFGGGIPNNGVVFELSPGGGGQWTQQVLYTYAGGADGYNSHASLALNGGNLYGTTVFGGLNGNNGTIFELQHLNSGQWQEQVLYSFCSQFECTDGSSPLAEVTFDKSGNLYGTTDSGGASQSGVVFELTKPTNGHRTEVSLYSFTGAQDGFNPHAGLVLDKNGNLYGVTFQGGTGGYGVAFRITPPNFKIATSPTKATVSPGGSTSSTLTISPVAGFTGTVALTCTVPSGKGLTCGVSPNSVTLNGTNSATATLSVSTSPSTPAGTYKIKARGSSGTLQHSTAFTLTAL